MFFGNTDSLTLRYISEKVGNLAAREIAHAPPEKQVFKAPWWALDEQAHREKHAVDEENRMRVHAHDMSQSGRPRATPEEIAALVGKGPGDPVARSMIVFAPRGTVLNLGLSPYFESTAPAKFAAVSPLVTGVIETENRLKPSLGWAAFFAGVAVVAFILSHRLQGALPAAVLFFGALFLGMMAVGVAWRAITGRH